MLYGNHHHLDVTVQVLKLVDKDKDGNVHQEDLMGVAFVPLTEPGMDPFVGKDED